MKIQNRLTEQQIEELAVRIREFLLDNEMWVDVAIYFNGKCFSTYDRENGKFYYNDREHLVVQENENPRDYFEYVNPNHILSMSFEGPVCHMISYDTNPELLKEFNEIFEKYGLYYELGHHWNMSCYYISEV